MTHPRSSARHHLSGHLYQLVQMYVFYLLSFTRFSLFIFSNLRLYNTGNNVFLSIGEVFTDIVFYFECYLSQLSLFLSQNRCNWEWRAFLITNISFNCLPSSILWFIDWRMQLGKDKVNQSANDIHWECLKDPKTTFNINSIFFLKT